MRIYSVLSRIGLSAALYAIALPAPPSFALEPAPSAYTLDSILDLALAKNPAVSSAEGTIDQQRGQQTAAGAYPNPTVTGYMGYGEVRDNGRADIRESLAREKLTEYNVTIGQPLEWPAMRAARQKVADAGLATANAGMSETRLQLTTQVKVAFYDLLLAQRDAALAQQNLDTVESVTRIVKARVKSGEAPQFESIKAEVEVLKARQQLARAENAVRVNRAVVDTLTGGALGPTYVIQGDFMGMSKEVHLDELIVRMGTEHPSIQRLLKSVEQSDWKIEFERQSRIPSVTVSGSYWREIGREAVQGGLSIPMPLWYRREGEIAASLGSKRHHEAELLRTRNELARAIFQHYQDARTTAALIDVFDKGLLKQAQEALRLAQFSFQQGASSLLDVFDAQRVQRQIQMDYAQARYELSVSLAHLERAIGGTL
ncbi:MAG: Heavy metal RND efflux outer membrane protein, CzcC family [Nitrospira sp.]|nr:MAG: Heavy metal RND efflux outer membrane protein, CzcC family [Nitrospira sp.]